MTASAPRGYVVAIPVYGSEYVELFLEVALPSLLAPGNLPALRGRKNCALCIYTTAEWSDRLTSSPIMIRVEHIVPVHVIALASDSTTRLEIMREGHQRGLIEARNREAAAIFSNADLVLSNGAIAAMIAHAEAGVQSVAVVTVRVNSESVAAALMPLKSDSNVIALTPRQLMSIGLPHMHMTLKQSCVDRRQKNFMPQCLLWMLSSGEYLSHNFYITPLMVHPRRNDVAFKGTIDYMLIDQIFGFDVVEHIVTDSDEIAVLDLTNIRRVDRTEFTCTRKSIYSWARAGCSPRHWRLLKVPVRLRTGLATESEWRRVERQAARWLWPLIAMGLCGSAPRWLIDKAAVLWAHSRFRVSPTGQAFWRRLRKLRAMLNM